MKKSGIMLMAYCALSVLPLQAQTSPTDLAELSLTELLRTHVIQEGDEAPTVDRWAVGYRYVRRTFHGYREGTNSLTFDEVLQQFPVVPTKITQGAHLVDVSFQRSPTLSFSVLLPFIEQETDHIRRVGAPFTLESQGVGDPLVSADIRLWKKGIHTLSLNAGLSFPTGSIDELGDTPRGPGTPLPYTMQTGAGTYDLHPGLTYTQKSDKMMCGLQATGDLRLGRNDRGYSLGDRLLLTGWINARFGRLEPLLKLRAEFWNKIDGADVEVDPNLAPVANPNLFGGERLDVIVGLRVVLGDERKHAIALEGGVPAYQSLNGPQPERDRELTFGWQSSF